MKSNHLQQLLDICDEYGHAEVIAQVRRAWAMKEQLADPFLMWDEATEKANAEPHPAIPFELV